jgi:two-component system, NarL family, sensor histidine kinase DesK
VTGAPPARFNQVWWSKRRSRVFLAGAHLPFLAMAPLSTLAGVSQPVRLDWIALPLAIAIGAVQLRHSFDLAAGRRPAAWPVSLAILGILVFAPLPWLELDWASIQVMFVVSAALLLHGRPRQIAVAAPVLGTAVWSAIVASRTGGGIAFDCYYAVFWAVGLSGAAACLYGAVYLVQATDDLFATRAEMTDVAARGERLRVSRDLHDLLGQSLSSVSIKGELALALLRGGTRDAAKAEVRELAEAARDALANIDNVVHGSHTVSLAAEAEGARILLSAASIDAHVDVGVADIPPDVDELFGWATREGVTNMLRHSQAAACSITAGRRGHVAYLEILNDGAGAAAAPGNGLAGLADRAESLSGQVSAGRVDNGRFRLYVEVPRVLP